MVSCGGAKADISFPILKPAATLLCTSQLAIDRQADSQYNAGEPAGQISYHASDRAG